MNRRTTTATRFAAALGGLALVAAGCANESSNGPSSAIPSDQQAAAQRIIDPYLGQPGEFPVKEPLSAPMPSGVKIAYIDNGNALVALLYKLMQPAAKQLGIELYAVRAGTSASGVQSAFSTALQQKPDAVVNTAIDPALWSNERKQLHDAGIPIVSLGTVADGESGLVQINSTASFERQGQLQAAWLVANNDETFDAVLYESSELAYAEAVRTGFESQMEELCPDCGVRVVQIPLAEVGNKAPDRIVSDLQANPDTDAIVFQSSAAATGLPSKLKLAGLEDIQIVGGNPLPTNLQYLKNGESDVEVAADLNTLAWTAIDTVARLTTGQDVEPAAEDGSALVQQILRPEDVTFDPTMGFSGYPDVSDRFAEIWGK